MLRNTQKSPLSRCSARRLLDGGHPWRACGKAEGGTEERSHASQVTRADWLPPLSIPSPAQCPTLRVAVIVGDKMFLSIFPLFVSQVHNYKELDFFLLLFRMPVQPHTCRVYMSRGVGHTARGLLCLHALSCHISTVLLHIIRYTQYVLVLNSQYRRLTLSEQLRKGE